MGVNCVKDKGGHGPRLRLCEDRNRGREKLGVAKGGVKDRRSREIFYRTLKGVSEKSKDLSSIAKKSLVKVNYTQKLLKSRFIGERRKSLMAEVFLSRGWRPEWVRLWPRTLVSRTANLHLPRPIVRPWARHSSRMSQRC